MPIPWLDLIKLLFSFVGRAGAGRDRAVILLSAAWTSTPAACIDCVRPRTSIRDHSRN